MHACIHACIHKQYLTHWIGSAADLLKAITIHYIPSTSFVILCDQTRICMCVCTYNQSINHTLMIAWWLLIRVSFSIILSWSILPETSNAWPLSSLRRAPALDSVSAMGFVPWPASEELNAGSLVTADNVSLITSGTSGDDDLWLESVCSDKRFMGFGSDKNTNQVQ